MKKAAAHREYPREVWVLSPAYIPRKITITKPGWLYPEKYDRDANGKAYKLEALHETKAGAIQWGRQQIEAREEYLAKQHALLDVRRIKLDKAEKA